MKAPRLSYCTIGILAVAAGAAAAQPVLVRVTSETIARLRQNDPMIRMEKPSTSTPPIVRPEETSLVKESTILHDGSNWTMVPNGAVIHLPESQRGHINARPVGNLMSWRDFLAKNSAWLSTRDISFDQAAGNEKVSSSQLAEWREGEKIVIAVHQKGPIRMKLSMAEPELSQK